MRFSSAVSKLVMASAVVALVALSATAAPVAYTDIRVAGGGNVHSATVHNVGDVVLLDLYMLVRDTGQGTNGWTAFSGQVMSSQGGLQGDMAFNPVATGTWGPGVDTGNIALSLGSQPPVTLDGDADTDLGTDNIATTLLFPAKSFNYTVADGTQVIEGVTYQEYKLASGIAFTVNNQSLVPLATMIFAYPTNGSGDGSLQFTSDGNYVFGDASVDFTGPDAVTGGNNIASIGTAINLVPEPATMVLLSMGVGAILARRRSKK